VIREGVVMMIAINALLWSLIVAFLLWWLA
jgi:hypothetical protein